MALAWEIGATPAGRCGIGTGILQLKPGYDIGEDICLGGHLLGGGSRLLRCCGVCLHHLGDLANTGGDLGNRIELLAGYLRDNPHELQEFLGALYNGLQAFVGSGYIAVALADTLVAALDQGGCFHQKTYE